GADHSVATVDLVEGAQHLLRVTPLVRVMTEDGLPAVPSVGGRITWFAAGVHVGVTSVGCVELRRIPRRYPRAHEDTADVAGAIRTDFALGVHVRHTGRVARTRRHPIVDTVSMHGRGRVGRASTTVAGEQSPAGKVG